MKNIASFISLLLVLSFSLASPLYAASHEKKAGDAATMEVATDKKSEDADSDKKKKGEDEEEPDCD